MTWIDLTKRGHSRSLKNSSKIWMWSSWNKEQFSLLEDFNIHDRIWIKKSEKVLGVEFEWNLMYLIETSRMDEFEQGSWLHLDGN
jgi:hypothetical protein